MKIKYLELKDIKPYENNPFIHSQDRLERVKESILSNEYINPIIVDKFNVIIAGHLRYKALRELKYTDKVECIDAGHLSAEQTNKYRILDNDPAEYDYELLEKEILSIYPEKELEKILTETGISAESFYQELVDDIEKQDSGFLEGNPDIETKNETTIQRTKSEAEIRFTISIEQYDLYTSMKQQLLKLHNVKSPGELFMLFILRSAKDFGLS